MLRAPGTAVDPRLEEVMRALADTGWAAEVADADWRLQWVSEELWLLLGSPDPDTLGFGQPCGVRAEAVSRWVPHESQRAWLERHIPFMLAEGVPPDEIRAYLRPEWDGLLESLEPAEPPPRWSGSLRFDDGRSEEMIVRYLGERIHAPGGELLGICFVYGSALPATLLAMLTRGGSGMYHRMARLADPARRETAVLFADLQGSATMSRKLSSAAYFALLRDLMSAIDGAIARRGGIVGKHAGDGASGFFLVQDLGSPSQAARAAVEAAREITERAAEVAKGHEGGAVEPESVCLNIGVHWGGTLYMGQVVTGGRLEVSALGDAVNECARVQESARDGEILASKDLLERLEAEDAEAVGCQLEQMTYRLVSELPDAPEKAIRDAGSLAVATIEGPDS
ncbi:MAG: adenylate/guanylate cyclase domain-containing protein [Thermoleophilaceae bacterium]